MISKIGLIASGFESFAGTLEKLRWNTFSAFDSRTSTLDSLDSVVGKESQKDSENDEVESNELPHKKGHPFYYITPDDLIPKFRYLEHFSTDDYCFFKPDVLERKLSSKKWNNEAVQLCITVIHETVGFCVDRKFANRKGVATMEMMLQTFDFLMWNMYATIGNLHKFVQEMILLYAVDDVPTSMLIFPPLESFSVLQYFAKQFDAIFLLFKAVCLPNFLVKIPIEDDQNE